MPLQVALLSLLVVREYRVLPLFAAAAEAAAACCWRCCCCCDAAHSSTAAGVVVSVAIDAIFSRVLMVQAQRRTTLATPVFHGRRAGHPSVQQCVLPLLLLLWSATIAILSVLLLLVQLLRRCLLVRCPCCHRRHPLCCCSCYSHYSFFLPRLMLYPQLTCVLCVVSTLDRLFLFNVTSRTHSVHPDSLS